MSQELCVKSDKVYVKRDGLKVTHRDFSRVSFLPNILKETESCKTCKYIVTFPLYLSYKDIPYISNTPCMLKSYIDTLWPIQTLPFIQFMRESASII